MEKWVTIWAQAHSNMKPMAGNRKDYTVRATIESKISGSSVRIRFSNKEGKKTMYIKQVTVFIDRFMPVVFSGKSEIMLDVGESLYSDPINCEVENGTKIVISIAFKKGAYSGNQDQALTEISIKGNYTNDLEMPLDKRSKTEIKYEMSPVLPGLSGVEMLTEETPEVLVCFGDSITQQGRWTNPLERMLRDSGRNIILINKGIGGNQLLSGPLYWVMTMWGPAAISRFEQDVLKENGTTGVVFALGTNDIGMARSPKVLAERNSKKLYETFVSLSKRAKEKGLKTYIATVTARGECGGYHQWQEDERLKFNERVRNSTEFDGIFDFDMVTRNQKNPFMLDQACDSGDHLHPGMEGGRRMAMHAFQVLSNKNRGEGE